MLAKSYEEVTSLHEDTTYILGDLIMEGSLDGGDHPVVIDGNSRVMSPQSILLSVSRVE